MNKSFKHLRLPQYRQGDFGFSCATCKHMNPKENFYCHKYEVEVDPGAVCDAWKDQFPESNDNNT